MTAPLLPRWRRSIAARMACITLAMLPALAIHGWVLDPTLFPRLAILALAGLITALWLPWLPRHRNTDLPMLPRLLDAFVHAALLAALWPADIVLWPAVVALALALLAQRLLGGWAVNPFPPAALALAIGIALAQHITGADFAPVLVSLFDAALAAAAWLGAGLMLTLLGLWPARAGLAFALPVALSCGSGGVPASSFVTAAIVMAFVLADTRHLPATRSGQILVGAFAGLGIAALWLGGAPPVTIAGPVLLACALAPWIERLTLPRTNLST